MCQQVLPWGQALQMPHDQGDQPLDVRNVHLLPVALLHNPSPGLGLDAQEMAAMHAHFGNL